MGLASAKINFRCICVFFILCFEHQFLYLVPANWTLLGLDYQTICFCLEILLFLSSIVEFGGQAHRSAYSWIFVFGILLIITSAVAGMMTYGQSIITGLIVQRSRVGSLLMFFVLYKWYMHGKITSKEIWSTLVAFSFVYFAVCLAQFLLSGISIFTYSTVTEKTRYGSARYWFSGTYLAIMAGYGLDRIWQGIGSKVWNALLVIAPFILAFLITKTRMLAIAVAAAILFCYLIKPGSIRRKLSSVVVVLVALGVLASTQLGSDLVDIFSGSGSMTSDTLTVRDIGREYYVDTTLQDPLRGLFGCGYASSNNSKAYLMAYPSIYSAEYGYTVTIYPQDNGIIGVFFYYGIAGIVWWAASLAYLFYRAFLLFKKSGSTVFIGFAVFEFISSLTLTPTLFSRFILLPLITVLMIASENDSLTQGGGCCETRFHAVRHGYFELS